MSLELDEQLRAAGPDEIERDMLRLRSRRSSLFGDNAAKIQSEAVNALSEIAAPTTRGLWKDQVVASEVDNPGRSLAALSLDSMLDTWSEADLWRLINAEGVLEPRSGPAVVLHIVAANTALLAWSSVARALLVGAASLVRLPQGSPEIDFWVEQLQCALMQVSPDLAGLVSFAHWPSSDDRVTRRAVSGSDTVVIYGGDATVKSVRALTPPGKRFLGYGHRFSIGIVGAGADFDQAARGTALDMAIFDQQGCLSPQMIFVVGGQEKTKCFVDVLVHALELNRANFPQRSLGEAANLREASMMAYFQPGAAVRHDPEFAWSVVLSPTGAELGFGLPGYITVVPCGAFDQISAWLREHRLSERLQGVSCITGSEGDLRLAMASLSELGASYVCSPGELQRPPFSWREDNLDVLKSLI